MNNSTNAWASWRGNISPSVSYGRWNASQAKHTQPRSFSCPTDTCVCPRYQSRGVHLVTRPPSVQTAAAVLAVLAATEQPTAAQRGHRHLLPPQDICDRRSRSVPVKPTGIASRSSCNSPLVRVLQRHTVNRPWHVCCAGGWPSSTATPDVVASLGEGIVSSKTASTSRWRAAKT